MSIAIGKDRRTDRYSYEVPAGNKKEKFGFTFILYGGQGRLRHDCYLPVSDKMRYTVSGKLRYTIRNLHTNSSEYVVRLDGEELGRFDKVITAMRFVAHRIAPERVKEHAPIRSHKRRAE